jgi:hypothetical protein
MSEPRLTYRKHVLSKVPDRSDLGPIGHIPPTEAEANDNAALKETAIAA